MLYFAIILKTVLSWPVAAFAIAFLFKDTLPNSLINLLRRRVTLEGFGFKAEVDAQEQQLSGGENPAERKLAETQALEPSSRKAVNDMESMLRADLANIDPQRKESVLIRALAETRMTAGHEYTYNRIFGSQILALRQLNTVIHATVEDARIFFQPLPDRFPIIYKNYSFEQWLDFLRSSGLLIRDGQIIKITDIGRDFLIYITEKQLFEGKAG